MDEKQWLSCSDPWPMMRHLFNRRYRPNGASDRQFRAYCVAACHAVSAELGSDAEQCIEWGTGPARNPASWAMALSGDQKAPPPAKRADMIRCIFGNPLRPKHLCGGKRLGVVIAPDLHCGECRRLALQDESRVLRLAGVALRDHDWSLLPIVADALDEIGCGNRDLLDHLRGGPHWRGCWALDLLAGFG